MSRCRILAIASLCCAVVSVVWLILVLYLTNYEVLLPNSAAGLAPLGAAVLVAGALVSGYLAQVLCRNQPHNRRTATIAITGMLVALGSLGLVLSLLLLVAEFGGG